MKVCLLIFLFLPLNLSAQMQFYYPNAKKIEFPAKNIRDVLDSLHIEESNNFLSKNEVIVFKRFTREPLFIASFSKIPVKPELVKELIRLYTPKYNEYMSSYTFYSDLNKLLKENKLTDEFINNTFGKASFVETNPWSDSTKVYFSYNLNLDYKNGIINTIDVINYRDAISKHKLLINSYEVNGSDYAIGFDIEITNYESKTIKYIYFNTVAKNPVKDIVARKTFRGIGPLEMAQKGTYNFEDAIYSRVASFLSIESIKIVYMDGTQKILTKPMISSIIHTDWGKIE